MSKTDYDLTKIRGFAFDVDGVLSPSTIPMDDNGVPCRMANVKDGYAIKTAVEAGMKVVIITGADTPALIKRFASLGVADVYIKASYKLPILTEWMERNGLQPDEVVYCGDDIPDYHVMQAVGLPVAPRDADVEIKGVARYITGCDGGYGVAREIIEQVLRAQGKWMSDFKAFGW